MMSALFSASLLGAGKNIVFEFFRDYVIGSQYCRSYSKTETLLSHFNAESERSVVCLDEVGQKGGAKAR